MGLYTRSGRRRVFPPVVFGVGVLWHLLSRGGCYEAVHTASFPYFSVLAAALARRARRFQLVVDWHEVWSRSYWRQYLGPAGRLGRWIQALCARVRQRPFCFSRLVRDRLREIGGLQATLLAGEYVGPLERPTPEPPEPVVVFAGRHIPEKRVAALVPAIALARAQIPDLRCDIFGDGPERPKLERRVAEAGLEDAIAVRGIAPAEAVIRRLHRSLCMVLPSRREGYGLIVVESAAAATPSVVVEGPDNAATELVEEGVNGFVMRSPSPEDLADGIVRVRDVGFALRDSTADWFERNGERLSLEASLQRVLESYRAA